MPGLCPESTLHSLSCHKELSKKRQDKTNPPRPAGSLGISNKVIAAIVRLKFT